MIINYFYYQRQKIICSCCDVISKRQSKTIKLLSKGFERFIGMSSKQNMRIKIQQSDIDIFPNQTLLLSIDYLF